ncbi:MAG: hypothetical protein QXO70_02325 [Candidatus Pacearchaeota archaeon]
MRERKEVFNEYFKRIVNALKDGCWTIEEDFSLKTAGELDENESVIKYNPIYGDRLLTLLHEGVHIICPRWHSEKLIERVAVCIYKNLTGKEKDYLLILFMCLLKGGKDDE